jgi:hypothetical protein
VADKKRKRTKFVPGAVLSSVAAVSVMPAVALIDCGGEIVSRQAIGGAVDAGADNEDANAFQGGVSAIAFEAGYPTVAAVGFEGGYPSVANIGFDAAGMTVAAIGFDAFAPGVTAVGFGPDGGDDADTDAAEDAAADATEEG